MMNSNDKTKKILIAFTLGTIALAFSPGLSLGDQDAGDKVEHAGEKTKHKVKKGANRVKEAVCTDSDLECKAKKAGHRVDESTEKAKDKVD